jgi:hypothetical protein
LFQCNHAIPSKMSGSTRVMKELVVIGMAHRI